MLVHFPIALLFVAFFLDVLAYIRQDLFWEQAGSVILALGFLSIVAAILAGLVSEHFALVTPQVAPILRAHRRDGLLTGFLFLLVLVVRFMAHRQWLDGDKARGEPLLHHARKRMSERTRFIWKVALGAYSVALLSLAVTGVVGGSMVYDHGLGVATPPPGVAGSAKRPPTQRLTSPAAVSGARIWTTTCSRCHGSPSPFTQTVVQSRGEQTLIKFISTNMPPGSPVGTAKATDVVAYMKTLP